MVYNNNTYHLLRVYAVPITGLSRFCKELNISFTTTLDLLILNLKLLILYISKLRHRKVEYLPKATQLVSCIFLGLFEARADTIDYMLYTSSLHMRGKLRTLRFPIS